MADKPFMESGPLHSTFDVIEQCMKHRDSIVYWVINPLLEYFKNLSFHAPRPQLVVYFTITCFANPYFLIKNMKKSNFQKLNLQKVEIFKKN